jgi:tryptophan-rich sensory protein
MRGEATQNSGWTSRWKPIVVAACIGVCVAILGGLATDIGPWYRALRKPSFQPPDWLFGPAWTVIYALTALSAATAWRSLRSAPMRVLLIRLFAFNILLNILWSAIFFRLKRPDFAMVEVIFFWASIAALFWVLWPRSRMAAWLLAPYLVWVTFASILNLAIVQLNMPI